VRRRLVDKSWLVSVERYEYVLDAIVYYSAPGDQTKIVNLMQGMEVIGKNEPNNSMLEIFYSCGSSPGDAQPAPTHDCTKNWATIVRFPRYWDGFGIENTDAYMDQTVKDCPATHPYKLPEINILVRHPNGDGKVPKPLQVSTGVDEAGGYTHMHGDYICAAQREMNLDTGLDGDGKIEHTDGGYSEKALMDLCLREAPDELEFNNERCRPA